MRIVTLFVTCVALAGLNGLAAQTPSAFEVASVRRNTTGNQQGGGLAGVQPGGRFVAIGATLRRLISDAYDGIQIASGPAWLDTERFDIDARTGSAVSPTEMRVMLRSLLVERFTLVAHVEAREQPIYTLVLGRSDRRFGPQLRASDGACSKEEVPACGDFRMGAGSLLARGMSMPMLARVLRGRVGRQVVDRTGLPGAYDLELRWASDLGLEQAPPGSAGAADLTPDGLSLSTALQEQLGLRLQPGRGPVDVVVVDSAEPATAN